MCQSNHPRNQFCTIKKGLLSGHVVNLQKKHFPRIFSFVLIKNNYPILRPSPGTPVLFQCNCCSSPAVNQNLGNKQPYLDLYRPIKTKIMPWRNLPTRSLAVKHSISSSGYWTRGTCISQLISQKWRKTCLLEYFT